MTAWSLIWIAAILGAFITATATKVLTELSWHELQEYCRLRKLNDLFDEIHDHDDSVAATTEALQIICTITTVLATAALAPLINEQISWFASALIVGGLWLVLLAVLLWIPREIAERWGPPFLIHTWRFWRAANRILRPLHFLASGIHFVLRRLDSRPTDPSEEEALEDEILSIVTEGQHDGLLEPDVREMIEGVIELDDTDVADIMTPRSKMDAIQVDTQWRRMLQMVVKMGRTRIPIYDKNLDDIVGVLYVKDLLAILSDDDGTSRSLRQIVREVWKVPRSTRLDELLQKFLHTRSHLAIVVDEFMHVVGLVTIEDVLEEIVGEIVDESDKEEVGDIRQISDHVSEINARAHLEEINEQLGTQLPEDQEYDTLGGLLLSEMGRIPKVGESLEWHDLRMTIVSANKRRVETVRVETQLKPKIIGAS